MIAVRLLAGLVLLAAAPSLPADAAAPTPREVYLIQNSGWMEPFYLDPTSQFRPLLHAFIARSTLPGAEVTIASFNQAGQLGDIPSPLPLFNGPLTAAGLDHALAELDLPRRKDGLYTDADYNGALSDAIATLLHREPGVIWMVTNNKNSRSNDQHVVENTSRFSTLLTGSDFIAAIVAYPLRMPAHGPQFSENGLVVYGIAYGAPAARWLAQATTLPAMRSLVVNKPVRLKPLTQDPLTLTLTGGTPGLRLARDGGAIVVGGLPGGRTSEIDIPARLTSNYYPQVIESAQLQADFTPAAGGPAVGVAITPAALTGMGPDETLDGVHVHLSVPALARPPGLAGLFAGERRIAGVLRLQLTDVHLTLQQAFVDKMRELFGDRADAIGNGVMHLGERQSDLPSALPAVFLGHQAVTAATTSVPVVFVVGFSALPLILLVGGLAALLVVLGGLLLAASRERSYPILVGHETMTVPLRPFRSTTLRARDGTRVSVTGRLLGRHRVVPLS